MSSVNVPGYLIKDIGIALSKAFPDKTQLQMMVKYQLSENLNEIADGENLKQIIFKLVNYFETKNHLPRLIDKARKENEGNPELQEVAKKFFITMSLFEILQPLEDKYFEKMQEAYKACYSKNGLDYWDDKIPKTIKEILDNIEDIPQQNYEEKLSQFAVNLLNNQAIPQKSVDNLKEWGKKYINSFSEQLERRKNEIQEREEQDNNAPSYLMIILHPSQQYKERYRFEAWFIPNGKKGQFNPETGEGYISLKQDEDDYETIKFEEKEIAKLLTLYFDKIYQHPTFSRHQTSIEFVLPNELLNQPIDNWTIQADEDEDDIPSPIGNEYKVIVRSNKRLKKYFYKYKNDWEQKWKTFIQCPCSECFVSDDYSEEQLYYILLQQNVTALKLIKSPSPEIFAKILTAINKSGIPVALWIRQELQDFNIQAEIDDLLRSSIIKLPERVKEKRLQASSARDKQTHIGNHISLLWENPDILPPTLTKFTTP